MAFAWHNLKLNRNKTGCIFQLTFGVFDIGFTFSCQDVFRFLSCCLYNIRSGFKTPDHVQSQGKPAHSIELIAHSKEYFYPSDYQLSAMSYQLNGLFRLVPQQMPCGCHHHILPHALSGGRCVKNVMMKSPRLHLFFFLNDVELPLIQLMLFHQFL